MGLEETDGIYLPVMTVHSLLMTPAETPDDPKSPRGVRGFRLNKGHFSSWKVQGKVGGYLK